MYARITTADGDFNVTCDVPQAGAMVAFGLLRYDGEASPGEHCYTVADDDAGAVQQFIAEGRWADNREKLDDAASNNPPGYPGEPPAGGGRRCLASWPARTGSQESCGKG